MQLVGEVVAKIVWPLQSFGLGRYFGEKKAANMTVHDLYRVVRNQVRELGHRESLEIIWAYCQYLQVRDFELPAGIQAAREFLDHNVPRLMLPEWILEQIAREVIRDAGEGPRRGRTLRDWNTLARIAQAILDLENQIYGEIGGGRILLETMRISHRQFVWQQGALHWRWAIRYYKLFNAATIRELIAHATGLTVDQIFLIGLSLLGNFFQMPRASWEDHALPDIEQYHIERFLAFTCLPRSELARRLRSEHQLDEGYAYRYSSLRAFPLVKISYMGAFEIACPIPTLLFWRITTGLYYELREQPRFPTAFGDAFQNYVGEVLQTRVTNEAFTVHPESEYQVGRNRKDTVDWIIQQGNEAAIFLECKTKRMTWASKAGLTDIAALDQDIRKLAGAVVQVYRTIADYRNGLYPQLPISEGRQIYPLIVTLEDWFLFGMDLPERLDISVRDAMRDAELSVEWLTDMPYSVVSIDDLETVAGVIDEVGVQDFMQGKLSPEFRKWAYRSYCSERYPDIVRVLPWLFRNEYDALFDRMRE